MDGLEAVELTFNQMLEDNEKFRIDSEFFKKEYWVIEDLIKSKKYIQLKDTNCTIKHPSEIKREYVDSNGVIFFRTQNLRPLKIDFGNKVFISLDDAKKLSKNIIQVNDILMTRTGANFGDTAIYNEKDKAIASSHIFMINNTILNQSYISVFLNTMYGRKLINKGMYGGVQPEIAPYYLKNIFIPHLTDNFQLKTEELVILSYRQLEDSKKLYKQSEELLLKELDLLDFEPSKEKIAIKSFSESFGECGRLDSEYYQPKYDEITEKIKSYKGGYKKLEYFSENYSTGYPFKSDSYVDDGTYLIRINNIKKGYLDISNASKIPNSDKELSSKDIAKENDILISMSGTIGNSCKIPKNISAVINQRIMKITPQKINFELLPLLINSIIGQNQLERIGTGGVQTNISSSDILSVLIPIIDNTIQTQIEEKIKESFKLKEESKQLLEVAKRAVEIAIEDGENLAMEYIKDKR